ncbi:hypothetical protein V1478_012989 [Vespula squamosa]|uniref:Uncharacterized protein n=1 Tax=Vespula squamosa TaxID=30214 RepID=A0ABD2A9J3_VESSQ
MERGSMDVKSYSVAISRAAASRVYEISLKAIWLQAVRRYPLFPKDNTSPVNLRVCFILEFYSLLARLFDKVSLFYFRDGWW